MFTELSALWSIGVNIASVPAVPADSSSEAEGSRLSPFTFFNSYVKISAPTTLGKAGPLTSTIYSILLLPIVEPSARITALLGVIESP